MNKIILYIFSFFLGFGLFDPFGTSGLYLDILTVLALISILINNGLLKLYNSFNTDVKLLASIALVLFFSAVIYGISYEETIPINFKFIAAIIIFWFFSLEFSKDDEFRLRCISLFALSCSIIALGYMFGFFRNEFEVLNGRLRIFGENPNSISSRMAISFVVIVYNILFDPLKLKSKRFIGFLFLLPLVNFIIDTGSRGSLLIMVAAMVALVLLSKVKVLYKIAMTVLVLFSFIGLFFLIKDTPIMHRFINEGLTDSRNDLWDNALSIFVSNPVIGVGEEGYRIEMNQITNRIIDTHNLFIYFLVTGGVLAFSLFGFFLLKQLKVIYVQLLLKNSLPAIILIFYIFLMSKTGGIITYLIMWYFFAYINSYSLNFKNSTR